MRAFGLKDALEGVRERSVSWGELSAFLLRQEHHFKKYCTILQHITMLKRTGMGYGGCVSSNVPHAGRVRVEAGSP